MNTKKLKALLAAGVITQQQFLAASADNSAPTIDLHMFAPGAVRLVVEQGEDGATTGGVLTADVVTRYDELIESHGMIIHAGALEPRQPLVKSKLLRDHNHSEPVGYMTSVTDDRLGATWQVASTEVDRVAQEFDEHLRDGLSVGFSITEYDIDDEWVLHVYRADWYETSLCAVPAVHEAGVTSVAAALATARKENRTMNRAQLAAALAAGKITQEQHDAALAVLEATEGTETDPTFGAPTATPSVAVLAGPEHAVTPAPPAQVRERTSLAQVQRRLITAANTGDTSAFTLALADIIPADDAAPAFLREDWQGEVWRNDENLRPWIDAFGAPKELKSLKGKAWHWDTEPEVDEYAGNKTEVPTNEVATAPDTFTAFRIAAGWDVDRAFEDFADEEFWPSFWAAVMRDYKRKSNAGVRTRLVAAASAGTGATVTAGGVKAVLKQVVRDIRPYGRANRIFLGDDLFEELEDLDTQNLPLWLKSATIGLDIAEGSADVGSLRILNDSTLADKQVVAFDNRAAIVREKSPFRVQALNVAQGGIDVGIYSYLRVDPQDVRAIVKRTYAPA